MRGIAVALLLCLAGAPARAAEGDPPVGWSVGSGVALAIVPLAVGGGLMATSDDHVTKHAGIQVIAGGLALAPIVSHLIAREWKRAIYFGIAPMAMAALAIGLLEGISDDVLDNGTPAPRVVFGAALALELVASAAGLIDSLAAGDRARQKKSPPVSIVPLVGKNQIGLSLGGSL